MKTLAEYLFEGRSFTLEDEERNALASLVGVLCGDYGDDDIEDKCKDLIDLLTDDEKKQLSELTDVLDDYENYRRINRNILKNDIPLIKKIITWLDDNDGWVSHNDYELLEILDKINN